MACTAATCTSEPYTAQVCTLALASHVSDISNPLIATAQTTQYVYCIKRENFVGNTLYPLNIMKDMEAYKEIYEREVKKYKGREHVMQTIISVFDCLWNGVIFLCPLDPSLIHKELTDIGFNVPEVTFYKIPIEVIHEKRATIWKYPEGGTNGRKVLPDDEFDDIHNYTELKALPERTISYYRGVFAEHNDPNKLPLKFANIPHVMCADPIDITDSRITEVKWSEITSAVKT